MTAFFSEWLQLFPSLRRLRFETQEGVSVVCLTDTEFLSSVAVLCPGLEMIAVNQEPVIDLKESQEFGALCRCFGAEHIVDS
jgi:hypothetical protein